MESNGNKHHWEVKDPIRRVELALEALTRGEMVILMDDEDRENEGDLIIAAEKTTPEAINFMATHARGLICLSLTRPQVERLGLSFMSSHNQSAYNTAFTVSVEAREGVTTGISAADRARTVQVAIQEDVSRFDIVTPGHMFPLQARDGGVLERVGQTEGSVDLAVLAGLKPAAVICEIMNPDGTMARLPDLAEFAKLHSLQMVTVADIIKYRMRTERVVEMVSEGTLEIPGLGLWHRRLYHGLRTGGAHMALWKGPLDKGDSLVRVQSAPPPWAFAANDVCRGSEIARAALGKIAEAGSGVLVLMHLNPTRERITQHFMEGISKEGGEVHQAHAEALRDLGAGCQILRDLGVEGMRLLTNSPRPLLGIEAYGLTLVGRDSLLS